MDTWVVSTSLAIVNNIVWTLCTKIWIPVFTSWYGPSRELVMVALTLWGTAQLFKLQFSFNVYPPFTDLPWPVLTAWNRATPSTLSCACPCPSLCARQGTWVSCWWTWYVSIMLVNLTSILWNLWVLQLQSYLLLLSQALLLGDIQWPNGMINVKGYWVPSLAAEGIINMLLFISPIARLPSLALFRSWHGPVGTTQTDRGEPRENLLFHPLFSQLYF